MQGLAELKVKESDRLSATAAGLAACGVEARVEGDDLIVEGNGAVEGGGTIQTHGSSHRHGLSTLGLGARKPVTVDDTRMIATSFPDFMTLMTKLGAKFSSATCEASPMDIASIKVGENPPHEVNVIIEIPQGGVPVKYEVDKDSGAMFVDRFLHTAMFYPANYGFIPHTLSEDGDPVDCMVIAPTPVATGGDPRAADRRAADGGREGHRREDHRRADRQAASLLQAGRQLSRPAGDHDRADRPFLRALQGSRERQMGEAAALGRAARGAELIRAGIDRARRNRMIIAIDVCRGKAR